MLVIATAALAGIAVHLVMRFAIGAEVQTFNVPLWIVLGGGGLPLVLQLLRKIKKLQFGSDLLTGILIVTAVLLHESLCRDLSLSG